MRIKETSRKNWLLMLLALVVMATSCSKDDIVVTTRDDYCYIKSVTLGTVKRKVGTISSSFPGSYYAMTINLRDNTIENRDSLPFGSLLVQVDGKLRKELQLSVVISVVHIVQIKKSGHAAGLLGVKICSNSYL